MIKPELKLTEQQKQRLEAMVENIEWLSNEISKAELAEIDVSELRINLEKLKRQREKMLEIYG